jgi:hypothetical protein
MPELVQIALELGYVILAVDFSSGLLHWLEDSYGQPHWPVTGRLVTVPNMIHHDDPRHFTEHSWLRSADVLIAIGVTIVTLAAVGGMLTWHVVLFVLFGINAYEIHKWTHQRPSERSQLATWLLRTRVLQSPAHHGGHHQGSKDTHYCVILSLLNPILDRVHFWRLLEAVVLALFGMEKRLSDPHVVFSAMTSAEPSPHQIQKRDL